MNMTFAKRKTRRLIRTGCISFGINSDTGCKRKDLGMAVHRAYNIPHSDLDLNILSDILLETLGGVLLQNCMYESCISISDSK